MSVSLSQLYTTETSITNMMYKVGIQTVQYFSSHLSPSQLETTLFIIHDYSFIQILSGQSPLLLEIIFLKLVKAFGFIILKGF